MNSKKNTENRAVYVRTVPIRLGQFLKFANLVQDGLEAKIYIQEEQVFVNGEVEKRRGRQLVVGDVVNFNGQDYFITDSQQ